MAGFTDLHDELLAHICTFLALRDLAALALTAKGFNHEAERQLYRHIDLYCGPNDLVRTLGSLFVQGRRRYRYVRTLSVVLDGRPRQVLADAINYIKNTTALSLYTNVPTPCEGVRTLPPNLTSLNICWHFFRREQFFELLGTVPQLEHLAVMDWPQGETDDLTPAGALPALRSICGSVFMLLALLPPRDTITSVKIRSDYVWTPVMDALTGKPIIELEVPFETSTVEGICAAIPNVETLCFSEIFKDDFERWLEGRFPDGFHKLKNLRALTLHFELIRGYDFIAPGSAAALRAVLQPILPKLESVTFFSHIPFWGQEHMQSA